MLADRVNKSQRWISNVENGSIPRLPNLRQLADALGVDRGVLIAAADLTRRADIAAQMAGTPNTDALAVLHERIDPYLREVAGDPALADRLIKSVHHTTELLQGLSQPPVRSDDAVVDEEWRPEHDEAPAAPQDQ